MQTCWGLEQTVQYRRLGNTDLEPSVLGFGCSMIASLATRYSQAEVEATLCEARDAGVTFFDTADVYGQGDSERMLGKLFSHQRRDVLFCTKAGLTVGPVERLVKLAKPIVNPVIRGWRTVRTATTQARRRQERQCFEPEYLSQRIEGSLRRLNVDHIDLFLLHNPPVDVPQRDAVFSLLTDLKRQGKLRQYGVSCRTVDDAYAWLEQPDIACLQIPIDRSSVESVASVLERAYVRGIGVIAREVFSQGVLARDSVVNAVSPLLARPEISVVLAGMTCRQHLHENLRAVDVAMRPEYVA
jgi:aryl-alcohol dehydrogenase-like predicted oxidoreductase